MRPGADRLDEVQPVTARAVRGALGHDFDHLAGLDLIIQRHHAVVDPCADAVVAHVGVNPVCKIHRCRAQRQVDNLAARRKHKNLFLQEVALEALDELRCIGDFVAPRHQPTEPDDFRIEVLIRPFVAILVAPVRGDAVFGDFMHIVRTDLHLTGLPAGYEHGGVQ